MSSKRNGFHGVEATYSWANATEKQIREHGVDFRPPSIDKSWSWIMDNSQFGSDGQWLPSGENLRHDRHALLLEYLPNARTTESQIISRNLALKALGGARTIQKALLRHGDQSRNNVLVTKDSRVVWVDFDRAQVFDRITEDVLVKFKKDLINVHGILSPSGKVWSGKSFVPMLTKRSFKNGLQSDKSRPRNNSTPLRAGRS